MVVDDSAGLRCSGRFTPTDLGEVRKLTTRYINSVEVDPDAGDRFILAVSEAVANVIEHTDGRGELVVAVTDGQLVAEIAATGPGPTLDVLEPVRDRTATHGRGLWLMHQLTDRVEVLAHAMGHRLRIVKVVGGQLCALIIAVAAVAAA